MPVLSTAGGVVKQVCKPRNHNEMTLFLAQTRLATIQNHSFVPRLQRIPALPSLKSQVQPHRVPFQCSAFPVDNGGPVEAESVLVNSSSERNGAVVAAGGEPRINPTESRIEKAIYDFRFLTLMAIGGSLVGSLLCFLKGCGFVFDSYMAYIAIHLAGVHTGKVILRLVEAVEIYLVGTVMLIFAMGLFGLFISNDSDSGDNCDRALKNTTLFGMFALTKRPAWMQITNLDTLKTKLGHCIVMILIVKLFEKSKTVHIASSVDLLLYAVAIFMASGSLYVLHELHSSESH